MLGFANHPVRLEHMNVRTIFEGDDEVTIIDLKISMHVPNTELDKYSPSLRDSIFSATEQPDMLGEDANHMPHVKNPELGKLHWSEAYEPVMFRMHLGVGRKKDDLTFSAAKLDKIVFDPEEGGTVECVGRVRIQPSEDSAARLMMVLHREVRATLELTEDTEATGAGGDASEADDE
jgi:hypothetical protein